MHANQREESRDVRRRHRCGRGLKDVVTGDTLCDPTKIITLERMIFPEPVIHVAVEPRPRPIRKRWACAQTGWRQEDPSFRVRTDETPADHYFGYGELH